MRCKEIQNIIERIYKSMVPEHNRNESGKFLSSHIIKRYNL